MDTSKPVRIAFIGGASMTWMPSFAHDILSHQPLAGSTLVLMDIDADHLQTMTKYVRRMVAESGGDLRIESTTERAEALTGADYVVTTFGPGGHEYWKEDVGIALRYGIQEPAGMSVGPGGLMQGLKGIPTIVDIAQDMDELCPNARLFNYTNPMSSLTLAFNRYSDVEGVGVCPGIYGYIGKIARTLGLPATDLHYVAGGVNHMNWLLEVRHNGTDVLPQYQETLAAATWESSRARDKADWDSTQVRAKGEAVAKAWDPISRRLYELFGAWPVPGDGHTAEFVPYFIGKGRDIERRYSLAHDYIERRIEKRKGVWSQIESAAAGGGAFVKGEYESQERVELMIHAMEFNEPGVIYLNVMNGNAIPNVLPDACVELPVVVGPYGFHPLHTGPLPPGPAAITNLAAAVQDLTVEAAIRGDRQLALQALALDPLTYTLELEETEQMLDEMLEASRPVLPRFYE
jgi:alpha-galactosidase